MQLSFSVSNTEGAIATVLLCYIMIVAGLISLHSLVLIIRDMNAMYGKLDDNQRLALRCSFPLSELLQKKFTVDRLTLPDFPEEICILPKTDFGSSQQGQDKLNPALCALIRAAKLENFRAWGKTCV